MRYSALLFAISLLLTVPALAGSKPVPSPRSKVAGTAAEPGSRVVALQVLPGEAVLDRPGASQQLVVLGRRADGATCDVTEKVRFSTHSASVGVSPSGVLTAQRDGAARVTVSLPAEGLTPLRAAVDVTARNTAGSYRWDFARQIMPVLVRGGCSGTNCHGAAAGRAGFRLSFFGHDPDGDYEALVKETGGRRVNRADPGASLILLKATMALPHGGGLRFKPGSPEYRALARWIASGAPRGGDPVRVERLEILPRERLFTRPGETQRLLVTAYLSDGTREDVTDRALLESRNEAAVEVEDGRARFTGLGEAAVVARYGGQSAAASFTSTALPPLQVFPVYSSLSVVDREVFSKLRRLRVPPAPEAPDSELVRRLYLDLAGRIPTAAETARYCDSTEPGKREALIDTLLSGPEYPKHWRDNLNFLLMGRAGFPAPQAWAEWLEAALKEDRGWDRMVRELLLARPESPAGNAALHFLDSRFAQGDTGLDRVTRDVSRVFFGVDIQCARCHTHPEVASWQQNAYWGIAAFFGRTYRIQVKGTNYLAEKAAGEVQYFGTDKSQRPARPMLLTGESPAEPPLPPAKASPDGKAPPEDPELYVVAPEEAKEKTRVPVPKYSRRQRFVELAVNDQNPYFKRALVNWVWSLLMSRGLVEPVDQVHEGNPASHPELLEELSEELVRSRFSLKRLIRTIVSSQVYARSSAWKPTSPRLRERPPADLYAVAAIRPQSVQQLANSILVAAGYTTQPAGEGGAEADLGKLRAELEKRHAAQIQEIRRRLDSGTDTYQPNVAQALFLTNSRAFRQLLDAGGLAARLAKVSDDHEVVRQAYLSVLSRAPDAEESGAFVRHLSTRADRRAAAVGQIVWALVTSAEFRFVH